MDSSDLADSLLGVYWLSLLPKRLPLSFPSGSTCRTKAAVLPQLARSRKVAHVITRYDGRFYALQKVAFLENLKSGRG